MSVQRKHDRASGLHGASVASDAMSTRVLACPGDGDYRGTHAHASVGMAPRLIPKPNFIILLGLLFVLVFSNLAAGETIWGLTPYRVRMLTACDDTPGLATEFQADLCESVSSRIDALLGAAWTFDAEAAGEDLRRAAGIGSLIGNGPPPEFESLPPELIDELADVDKLMLVGIAAGDGRLRLTVRELDVRTRRWGAVVVEQVPQTTKLRDAAVSAILEAFSPLATIDKVEGKRVILRPKAADLPLRDKSISLVAADEVFQPVVRYNDREGKPRRITAIPWTFLTIDQIEHGELTCRLHSGLRTPLSGRRRGRIEQYALAVRGPRQPSTLVLQSRSEAEKLLGGYDVFSHPPDSKATVHIGRTDHRGSISIPPAEHPLRVLLIRNGGQTLARLPLVPGLEDTLMAAVPDDRGRLEAEGFINGLQEELVDMVSRREVLLALAKARIADGDPDEAEPLLEEIRALPSRRDFLMRLSEARKKITSDDPVIKRKIKALFDDTRKLLGQHLDDEPIEKLETKLGKIKDRE